VESPAKAKTIKKYLGKDFEVLASYGHVRDLVPKEGAVDPKHHFAMKYQVVERNQKHIDAISRALKKAKNLFLATDPDREGEAISWHLYELLKAKGELAGKDVERVVFYEITKNAVREAMAQPRKLSTRFAKQWRSRANSRSIWSMRNRRVARSIFSSASTSRHFCGRKCVPAYRPAAYRVRLYA